MLNILRKEMSLSASVLSYLFIAFALMFLIPSYPILVSVFFVTLGIFQSFQKAREANDMVFSALLPIAKKDVVKGRYLFVCFIECVALIIMALIVIIRMTVLKDSVVYEINKLMNANFFALGVAFFIFGLFNWIFVGGFFKTAYNFAKPFVTYIIVGFVVIGLAEALHYIPGLEAVNAFGTDHLGLQLGSLFAGIALYIMMTLFSLRSSCRRWKVRSTCAGA